VTQSEDSSPLGFSLRLIQDRDVNVSSRKVRNRDPVHHPRRRLLKRGVEKSEVLHTFEDSGLAARLLAPAGVDVLLRGKVEGREGFRGHTCVRGSL
jgi:hypothetical protein